jgi:hypothetical protein
MAAMPTARRADPAFQWGAMAPWILDWESAAEPDDAVLERWTDGLASLATRIDSSVLWCPRTGTVTAPAHYSDEKVTQLLRRSTAMYAGIDG